MTVSSSRRSEIAAEILVLSSRVTGPRQEKLVELAADLEKTGKVTGKAAAEQLVIAASWDTETSQPFLALAYEFDDGVDVPVPDKIDDDQAVEVPVSTE
jgi:hypothetical protein